MEIVNIGSGGIGVWWATAGARGGSSHSTHSTRTISCLSGLRLQFGMQKANKQYLPQIRACAWAGQSILLKVNVGHVSTMGPHGPAATQVISKHQRPIPPLFPVMLHQEWMLLTPPRCPKKLRSLAISAVASHTSYTQRAGSSGSSIDGNESGAALVCR
jgi:hypothetical protein